MTSRTSQFWVFLKFSKSGRVTPPVPFFLWFIMAITEIYVDPSINANSGSGTHLDPYGDLQHAFNSETLATSGTQVTRINIKSGTDEVMASDLNWSSFGQPNNASRPVILEGYTSTAGDGGRGSIDANNGFIDLSGYDYITLTNLDVIGDHDDYLVHLDNNCAIHNCYIEQQGNRGAIYLDGNCVVSDSTIRSVGPGTYSQNGLDGNSAGRKYLFNCFVEYNGSGIAVYRYNAVDCIVVCNGLGYGVNIGNSDAVIGNIIYSSAVGTKAGIEIDASQPGPLVTNNYVEGWSHANGRCVDDNLNKPDGYTSLNNYYFNCTTTTDGTNTEYTNRLTDWTLLGSSAITSVGSDWSLDNDVIRDYFVQTSGDSGYGKFYPFRHHFDESFGAGGGGGTVTNYYIKNKFTRL